MKRYSTGGVMSATLLLILVSGCDKDRPAVPRESGKRRDSGGWIDIEEPIRDLGEVFLSAQPRTLIFKVKNRGDKEIRVLEVRPSCSCTTMRLGSEVVLPGAETNLELSMKIDRAGERSASVVLTTTDKEVPKHQVAVYWEGVLPLDVGQPTIQFGDIRRGEDVTFQVKIRRRNPKTQILSTTIVPETLKVGDVAEVKDVIQLPITVSAADEPGNYSGRLYVTVQNGWPEQLEFPIRWRIRAPVEVTPKELFLGSGKSGDALNATVTISTDDGRPVKLRAVSWSERSGLTHQISYSSGGCAEIELTWTVPPETGLHKGVIAFEIDGLDKPLIVRATGFVLPDKN